MKKIVATLSVVLLAALVLAPLAVAGEKSMEKKGTHEMTVEVVSADAAAKTLTIKDEKGEPKTVPVMGQAVEALKNLKPGEKITILCQDNDKGEHQGVTHIKPANPTK